MKVFRKLTVKGTRERLQEFFAEIDQSLSLEWTRNTKLEERWLREGLFQPSMLRCFSCRKKDTGPGSTFFLWHRDAGGLDLVNIVPVGAGQISQDEYNAILAEFHDRFVAPAAQRAGVAATLTPDDPPIAEWTSRCAQTVSTADDRTELTLAIA